MAGEHFKNESEAPTLGQSADTAPTLLKAERTRPPDGRPTCPDENEIAALIQGLLPEDSLQSLEEHIDRCPSCAAVLAELGEILSPQDDAQRSATDGRKIGRYQVLESLGAGGMGVVSLAYDPRLKRNIALKLLHPELRDSPAGSEARRRLLREAQSLATLSHPNVLTVHDVGSWEDGIFIAMEFVQGATLTDWVKREAPGWREILQVFLQAGRGLAAAHAAGLVHRDVKPANILLGEDGRVRVTDFGLAFATDAPPTENAMAALDTTADGEPTRTAAGALTRTGALLGTPAYMAPEQLDGERADARSDQFSFCISLYEALSGRRPFRGNTLVELAESVRQDPVSETALAGVPRLVRTTLLHGLRPRPEDRFESLDALLGELEGALEETSAQAQAPAQPRGHLATLFSGIALVVAVVALALWLFLRPGGSEQSTRTGRAHPKALALMAASRDAPPATTTAPPATTAHPAITAQQVMITAPQTPRLTSGQTQPPMTAPVARRPPPARIPAARAAPSQTTPVDPRVTAALKMAKAAQRVGTLRLRIIKLEKQGRGRGCLEALAEMKMLDPAGAKRLLYYQATCTMLSGRCAAGKRLLRRYLKGLPNLAPANIDASIKAEASRRCPSSTQTPTERFGGLERKLFAAQRSKATATCARLTSRILRLLPKLLGAADRPRVSRLSGALRIGAMCLAAGGRCSQAKRAWGQAYRLQFNATYGAARVQSIIEQTFRASFPGCATP